MAITFNSSTYFQLSEEALVKISAHIPGFKEGISENPKNILTINHVYEKTERLQLDCADTQITLKSNWTDALPEDFIHLLYGVARSTWIKNRTFPVHAVCIGNDEKGYILIVGASGSGKTSVMLNSIMNKEFNIYSGDKTLVTFKHEDLVAVAGTHTVTVLQEDNKKWECIPRECEYILGNRVIFQLPSHCYVDHKAVKIKQIFFVKLNDGKSSINKYSPLSALHSLYPIFLDKQREDVLLAGDQDLFDGSITKDIKIYLAKHLYRILQKVEVYSVTGLLHQVTHLIKNTFNGIPENIQSGKDRKTPKKIVVGVCGIGNGHCNRQLPIINALLQQNHRIIILTYGDGLAFFENKFGNNENITIIPVANPYFVGCFEGLDFKQTALSEKNRIDFNYINSLALHTLSQQCGKPDLVISDYEMVAAQYAYAKQAPLVTLDQQSKYLVGDFIPNLNGTSCIDEIERLHMFFPVAAKRIAISFFKVPKTKDIDVQILPSVIKSEIIEAKKNAVLSAKPSILLYVTSQQLIDLPVENWISVLKSCLPKNFEAYCFLPKQFELPINEANIYFFHHGSQCFNSLLLSSHGIISTAGHTLLSEAMYLEKPVYAIPLPLYEQQLNAHVIAQGQFGISDKTLTEEGLRTFIRNLSFYKKNIEDDCTFLLKHNGNDCIIDQINQVLNRDEV